MSNVCMYDAATLMCIKMYNYNAPINEYKKKKLEKKQNKNKIGLGVCVAGR